MSLKKLALIGTLTVLGVGLVVGVGGFGFVKYISKPNLNYFVNYIEKDKTDKPASLVVKRNGKELITVNKDKKMPLRLVK